MRDTIALKHDIPPPFVPVIEADPQLIKRLSLGQDLYLTQACICVKNLPGVRAQLPEFLSKHLTDADVLTLQRITAPHHLNRDLLQCKPSGDGDLTTVCHADVIAWAVEQDLYVQGKFAVACSLISTIAVHIPLLIGTNELRG